MTHNIIMPDLGQTVAEGKIVRWLKRPGDKVSQGEVLLEVETDKVTMEVQSCRSGYLRAVLGAEGEMASALSPIAILTDTPDERYEKATAKDATTSVSARVNAAASDRAEPSLAGPSASSPAVVANESARPSATPAAKSRARELGLDLSRVAASRPDRLITREDVESAFDLFESQRVLAMAAIT